MAIQRRAITAGTPRAQYSCPGSIGTPLQQVSPLQHPTSSAQLSPSPAHTGGGGSHTRPGSHMPPSSGHIQLPSLQQSAGPSTHGGAASGSQHCGGTHTMPSSQVGLPPSSLHAHEPSVQHVEPSMQSG
ncbi:MAG: hypothetical protein U0168_22990 [Nannocystaceae bacterium]